MSNSPAAKFSIKPKNQDSPVGSIYCDNGHVFKFANFHQQTAPDGKVKYLFTGFCWECGNSIRVYRDEVPPGAQRDYRIITFIEP